MNINQIFAIIFALILISPMPSYAISPGESIDFDPSTGDYMINYMGWSQDGTPRMQHVRFVPATKIEPTVKSSLALGSNGTITYGYSIANGAKSRQPLTSIVFGTINTILTSHSLPRTWEELGHDEKRIRELSIAGTAALLTPTGWDGEINPSDTGGHRISWVYRNLVTGNDGLQPGQRQGGFGFASPDLPGIGVAELDGNSPAIGFPDEGPDGEISVQHQKLLQNDFVTRNAAIPSIAVPTPFDPAVTLERIQTQTHTWIVTQLLDATFSSQLDRYFQSAISAYRLNQPKVGKKQIQTMRELIKKEQPDADREDGNDDRGEKGDHDDKNKTQRALIDKLAARILDFDLKYVMKRAGGDKDD